MVSDEIKVKFACPMLLLNWDGRQKKMKSFIITNNRQSYRRCLMVKCQWDHLTFSARLILIRSEDQFDGEQKRGIVCLKRSICIWQRKRMRTDQSVRVVRSIVQNEFHMQFLCRFIDLRTFLPFSLTLMSIILLFTDDPAMRQIINTHQSRSINEVLADTTRREQRREMFQIDERSSSIKYSWWGFKTNVEHIHRRLMVNKKFEWRYE